MQQKELRLDWIKANVLTVILMIGSLGTAYASLTNRISVLEQSAQTVRDDQGKYERRIDNRLDRIEDKQDKMLELLGQAGYLGRPK